jgi:hypothetical protein
MKQNWTFTNVFSQDVEGNTDVTVETNENAK